MNLKWNVLFFLGLATLQAHAVNAVVIDAQALGSEPAMTSNEKTEPAKIDVSADPVADANKANKERALKSGKVSVMQKKALIKAEMADTNKKEGDAFLAVNKLKKGVVRLPSGVQYKILKVGKGKHPTENSVVLCRYRGSLIGGADIDKTDPKKPSELNVTGLLQGLKEAVKLMQVGAKWQIVIPPELAYGSVGNRGVGANAVLIYEFELVGIQ
jgi:FKBP-type peptidyl-prolyl cis-trans isomerase FklB